MMNEYSEIPQKPEQTNESAIQNFLNSLDFNKTANHLSDLVQPYVSEIMKSVINAKNSIFTGLQESKMSDELISNYRENSKKLSTSKTIEEIGEITGYCVKVLQFYDFSKKEVNQISKNFWESEFHLLKFKWFVDSKKNFKKGIGWNEKDSFIKELKLINEKHINVIRRESQKSLESVLNLIQEFFSFEKINYCRKLLNSEQEKIFQKNLELLLDALKSSSLLTESDNFSNKNNFQSNSFLNQILEPIFNCT